jgi:hypothetical protein
VRFYEEEVVIVLSLYLVAFISTMNLNHVHFEDGRGNAMLPIFPEDRRCAH